jgi:hemerythrin-like domain-containing protein
LEHNNEPIPKMVGKLRSEHRDFRLELVQIEEASKFSSRKAIEKLKEIAKSIMQHELEEARIIQIITEKVKEPQQWVKIIEEHKGMVDLLGKEISQLKDSSQELGEGINTFSNDMRRHFSDEEEIVFPLLLKEFSP